LAKRTSNDFEARLGEALFSRSIDLKELMTSWDKNGDGLVRKMEFRLHVRKVLYCGSSESSLIDSLFTELDKDKSGTLELKEVKAALALLKERAAAIAARVLKAQGMVDRCKERAEQAQSCVATAVMAEQGEAKLARLRDGAAIDARLGALLVKRNIKIGDAAKKWDAKGDGTVSRKEFGSAIKALGLQAEPEEIDELFCRFDTGGEGTLDVAELMVALKTLQDAAANNEHEVAKAAKFCVVLRKSARVAHAGLLKVLKEDEVEAKKWREEGETTPEPTARDASPTSDVPARVDEKRHAKEQRLAAKEQQQQAQQQAPPLPQQQSQQQNMATAGPCALALAVSGACSFRSLDAASAEQRKAEWLRELDEKRQAKEQRLAAKKQQQQVLLHR